MAALVACGDKGETATEEADADTDADTDTDTEEAGDFIYECVVPPMKATFQEYESKRFADFGCTTCHGKDAEANGYAMPSVFALNWDWAGQWSRSVIYVGDGSGLMEHVAGDMAEILGYDPYDNKTGEGFGCYND